MAGPIAATPASPGKHVSFAKSRKVKVYPKVRPAEFPRVWWTPDDYNTFRNECQQTLFLVEKRQREKEQQQQLRRRKNQEQHVMVIEDDADGDHAEHGLDDESDFDDSMDGCNFNSSSSLSMLNSSTNTFDRDEDVVYTTRGLESWPSELFQARQRKIRRVVRDVLDEQESQRRCGKREDERIAQILIAVSQHDVFQAHLLGLADEEEALPKKKKKTTSSSSRSSKKAGKASEDDKDNDDAESMSASSSVKRKKKKSKKNDKKKQKPQRKTSGNDRSRKISKTVDSRRKLIEQRIQQNAERNSASLLSSGAGNSNSNSSLDSSSSSSSPSISQTLPSSNQTATATTPTSTSTTKIRKKRTIPPISPKSAKQSGKTKQKKSLTALSSSAGSTSSDPSPALPATTTPSTPVLPTATVTTSTPAKSSTPVSRTAMARRRISSPANKVSAICDASSVTTATTASTATSSVAGSLSSHSSTIGESPLSSGSSRRRTSIADVANALVNASERKADGSSGRASRTLGRRRESNRRSSSSAANASVIGSGASSGNNGGAEAHPLKSRLQQMRLGRHFARTERAARSSGSRGVSGSRRRSGRNGVDEHSVTSYQTLQTL